MTGLDGAERIRQAAAELRAQLQRRARADEQREALQSHVAAGPRRKASGRTDPDGPHRLPEARAHLAREIATHQDKLDRYAALIAAGKKPMGRPPVPMEDSTRIAAGTTCGAQRRGRRTRSLPRPGRRRSDTKQLPKVVANTTDPQSRIMPTRKGFLQGYNAQVAVTGDQIIVAVQVGQSTNDQACFLPMMRAAQDAATRMHAATGNTDHVIGTVLADAGYNSDANLTAAGPDRLIALGKGTRPGAHLGRGARRRAATGRCDPTRGEQTPATHAGRPGVVQAARCDGRARHRQPQEDHRSVLPPRPGQRNQRIAPGGDRVQPHEDPPGSPTHLNHPPR